MRLPKRWMAAVSIFGTLHTPVVAQDLMSLANILQSDHEDSYPFIRCAAFYQANIEWAGTEQLGQESLEQLDQSIQMMLGFGVQVRAQNQGNNIEAATESVVMDTRRIADIYLERYRTNYASTGQAWASDELWVSDLEYCKVMTEHLGQALSD